MKVVIDTNVLLVSISPRSESNWLWQALLNEQFEVCVTTEILAEYAEIIGRKMGEEAADLALDILTDLPNTHFIHKYFNWHIIEVDPDDNKFVDCAIAAGAKYLVSEDKHFQVLKQYSFLNTELISIEEFRKLFLKED